MLERVERCETLTLERVTLERVDRCETLSSDARLVLAGAGGLPGGLG